MKKKTKASQPDKTTSRTLTANDLRAVVGGTTVANNPLYKGATVLNNPLYESSGTSGTNPLYKA